MRFQYLNNYIFSKQLIHFSFTHCRMEIEICMHNLCNFKNFVRKKSPCWIWMGEGKESLTFDNIFANFFIYTLYLFAKKAIITFVNTQYGKAHNNRMKVTLYPSLWSYCMNQARSCVCEFSGKEITWPIIPLQRTHSSFPTIF